MDGSTMTRRRALVALLAGLGGLLLLGCTRAVAPGQSPEGDEAIFEAVLRELITSVNADAYYLDIRGADPSEALLRRFNGRAPRVRKQSQRKVDESRGPKRLAVTLWINDIRRVSDTEAEVKCGYHASPRSAAGWTYRLHWSDGAWKTIASRADWVS